MKKAGKRQPVPKAKPARKKRLDVLKSAVEGVGKAVGYYGTATKVAQLLPVFLGLLVLAFTPNAWLSGTLRRWSVWGMVAGGLAGALAFYVGGSRAWKFKQVATAALVLLVGAASLLRLHLALADVAFSERWRIVRGLHDYFLGTGDAQELLYNALAALWFALTLFAATLGLSALGVAVTEERRERLKTATAKDSLEKRKQTLTTELDKLFQNLEDLQAENRALKAEVAAHQRLVARLQSVEVIQEESGLKPPGTSRASKASKP